MVYVCQCVKRKKGSEKKKGASSLLHKISNLKFIDRKYHKTFLARAKSATPNFPTPSGLLLGLLSISLLYLHYSIVPISNKQLLYHKNDVCSRNFVSSFANFFSLYLPINFTSFFLSNRFWQDFSSSFGRNSKKDEDKSILASLISCLCDFLKLLQIKLQKKVFRNFYNNIRIEIKI